jgi:hypothetical protein
MHKDNRIEFEKYFNLYCLYFENIRQIFFDDKRKQILPIVYVDIDVIAFKIRNSNLDQCESKYSLSIEKPYCIFVQYYSVEQGSTFNF